MINRGRVRLSPATLSAPSPAIHCLPVRSEVMLVALVCSPGGPLLLATGLRTLPIAMTRMIAEQLERTPQGLTTTERDRSQAY